MDAGQPRRSRPGARRHHGLEPRRADHADEPVRSSQGVQGRLCRRRSPAWNAQKLQSPLLIHTTTNDEDVHVLEVENLIKALKAADKKFDHKIYKDAPGGHEFNRIDTKYARDSRAEAYRFLAKH